MAIADIQLVMEDLVNRSGARKEFAGDRAAYLAKFTLTDAEKHAFDDLDVSCLKATADFLSRFSDAELSAGSVWIKS